MYRDGLKEFTPCSRASPKFMTAMLGPTKHDVAAKRVQALWITINGDA